MFEAVQPVKLTPLAEWVARGDGGRFVVKRLRDAASVLTPQRLKGMIDAGQRFVGRDYDLYFEWSDDRVYCSELVWKVFEEGAGIELGELESMADFDLSHPLVREKIRERFGDDVPLDEVVISPAAIFNASNLITVYEN